MRKTLALSVLAVVALCVSSPVDAQDELTVKEQLALDLIAATGGEDIAQQIMDTMWAQLRPSFPSVPDEVWRELAGALDASDLPGLLVPIYVKHYSEEEMRGLIEFFESPLGRRLIELQPAVMQDSMAVGFAWGQQRFAEIIEKLKQRGFEPAVS